MQHIGIAGHRIEAFAPAARGLDLARAVAEQVDVEHRIVQPQGPAEPPEQRGQRLRQRAHSTARIPQPLAQHVVERELAGRSGIGIAAAQQHRQHQRLAQVWLADAVRGQSLRRAPTVVAEQRRAEPGQRARREPGFTGAAQFAPQAGAMLIEFLDPGDVARGEPGHTRAARRPRREIEQGSVGPVAAPGRADREQLAIGGKVMPGGLPQLGERGAVGQRSRAAVELKPVARKPARAPADGIARLDQHGLDAGGLQPDRQSEPAQPRADHAARRGARPTRCGQPHEGAGKRTGEVGA